jgi:hypothetical protein
MSPSGAEKPDLDWSQVRETVMMLNLATAQIAGTLREGDESVTTLANAFTTMVGNVESAHVAAEALPDSPEKDTIIRNCEGVLGEMQHVIMSFQFYDKLNQRLTNVSSSLNVLASLVSDPTKLYNPYEWRGLQKKIQSQYTVESERKMFEYIAAGHSVEEALAKAKADEQAPKPAEDDIELF